MNCKRATEYIYLQREIILSQNRQKQLEKHIDGCDKCKEELSKAGNYFSIVSNIQFDKSPVEDDSLVNIVMERINYANESLLERLLEAVQKFLVKPPVRYTIAASILFICLSYAAEEYRALNKINLLENKFSAISNKIVEAGPDLPINTRDIKNFITGDKKYLKLPGSWVIMKETSLIKKIEELSNQPGAELLINNQNDLQLLLNHPEVKKIIEKDDELKKIFNRIITEGAVTHEN